VHDSTRRRHIYVSQSKSGQGMNLLAASFLENKNAPVAPCNCVPALKMSLYAGKPWSAIALAM
jgi:hypothetical protein